MVLDNTQPTGSDATTTTATDTNAAAHTLVSPTPTSTTKATITINHQQLRDVLLCLHERGVVNYIQDDLIVRHDLRSGSDSVPLLQLPFPAFSFAGLSLPGTGHTLYAAGGHFGQIHLSMHPPYPSGSTFPSDSTEEVNPKPLWSFTDEIPGSMNNHLILTQLIPGSEDPRVVVCNNDCFLKVFDVPVRLGLGLGEGSSVGPRDLSSITRGEVGILKAEWPINQCSLSPDGRTLLTVGDSKQITLHSISSTGPSSSIHFQPITTLSLLPLPHHTLPFNYDYDYPPALFSSAFSKDGRKFAVSSQGGVVMVWDVRMCGVPVKVVLTDRSRRRGRRGGGGYDAWGARSLKFGGREGREVLVFNEHTSLTHIIDAQTFDTEEILTVPSFSTTPGDASFGTTPGDASFATTTPSPGAHENDNDLDLAGICFDPSGEFLYTGSTTSVVEWGLL